MTIKLTPNLSDEVRERCILVAVDFGTTFSGIAWAQTAQPKQQTTIVQWPNTEGSLEGQSSEKAPTELSFSGGTVRWGFQIPEDDQRYQWFKLGLDPEQEKGVSYLSVNYPDPKALPPAYGSANSPANLATKYLSCLREHTLHILKLKLGEGVVNSTPFRFIITVPAIWDDAAKARTQKCGIDAGMGDGIRIISEPEAAVVFALSSMDHHNLSPGDTFVLCDAGGGTVDLISYSILELQPLLKIRDAVPGSGHACGSTFLNRIFGCFLQEHISDAEGYDDDTIEDALHDFETSVKRKFRGEEPSVMIRVRGLVDNPAKGIKRGRLTVSGEKMKSLFEPVISAIITLVMAQLKQTKQAKAVILVGGFGQSPYLRNCIKKVVGNEIEVIQPVEGWSAVVKGALIKGLSETVPDGSGPSVTTRVSRKSYGISCHVKYDPLIHDEARKWLSGFEGEYRINSAEWFVNKGDEIDEMKPLTTRWTRTKLVSNGKFGYVTDNLYVYVPFANEKPPGWPSKKIKRLVSMNSNLWPIPTNLIPTERGRDGLEYYCLKYEIKINFFSAHTEYSLWYKGKEYGNVKAEYA